MGSEAPPTQLTGALVVSDQTTVAISGATGLVGSALTKSFEADGIRVLRLVRRPTDSPDEATWNYETGEVDAAKLEGIDAVIHLAGENVAKKRWSKSVKQAIADSRIKGTRLLAETVASLNHKPRVFVCASAIGYYGDRGHEVLNEESPAGKGFLAETCQSWEAACQPAWEADVRVVQMRIGVVLSPEGGALKKMVPLFRKGLGGPVGSGQQIVSWIALPDLVNAIRHVVHHDSIHGAINGTAPKPVSNSQLAKALGRAVSRPAVLPAPAAALYLMMGEAAGPLLLESADIRPQRLQESGFQFESPDIDSALKRVLSAAD